MAESSEEVGLRDLPEVSPGNMTFSVMASTETLPIQGSWQTRV